jgi:hypothetical protein
MPCRCRSAWPQQSVPNDSVIPAHRGLATCASYVDVSCCRFVVAIHLRYLTPVSAPVGSAAQDPLERSITVPPPAALEERGLFSGDSEGPDTESDYATFPCSMLDWSDLALLHGDVESFFCRSLHLAVDSDHPVSDADLRASQDHYLIAKWWLSRLNLACDRIFHDYERAVQRAKEVGGVQEPEPITQEKEYSSRAVSSTSLFAGA